VRADRGAVRQQLVDERERRRMPQVVRLGLEGESPPRTSSAQAAEVHPGFLGQQALLPIVSRRPRGEEREVQPWFGRCDQRLHVLGEAAPAVPAAREEELLADPLVRPIALRTESTSAPTRSQSIATSFMKEIRLASIAFAAYLVSSAERGSMK